MAAHRWISQVRKGLLEYCVLELLHQEPSYGYAMLKVFKQTKGLSFNESSLYLALSRMVEQETLETFSKRSGSTRQRHYFKLTAKGYEKLEEMREDWDELVEAMERLQRGEL